MITRILMPLLCLIALSPCPSLAGEGQDILVGEFSAAEEPLTNHHQALVTSGGILLNAIGLEQADGSQVIRALRSENDGSTWDHRGDISDPSPDVGFQEIQAVVTRTASSERLLVAYIRDDPNTASSWRVRVTSARVGAAQPNWTSTDILGP